MKQSPALTLILLVAAAVILIVAGNTVTRQLLANMPQIKSQPHISLIHVFTPIPQPPNPPATTAPAPISSPPSGGNGGGTGGGTTGGGTAGITTPSAEESQIAQAVFNAINQSRQQAGVPALQWSPQLANSARAHDTTMQGVNVLSHQEPGEAGFGDREHAAGMTWSYAAENIGVTSEMDTNGGLGLHSAMMAEQPPDDGHRVNILSTSVSVVGVDILLDTQHNELWLTEDFAQPA